MTSPPVQNPSYRTWAWTWFIAAVLVTLALVVEVLRCP